MPVVVTGSAINSAVVLWNNLFTSITIQSPASMGRINLTDPATWSAFVPTAANQIVTYDLGSAMSVDSVGLSAHTLATNGASFVIQYSSNNTTWTNAAPSQAPLTDADLLITFNAISARYWRVAFTGSGFVVGVIFGGMKLDLLHAPVDGYTPLHHARQYTKLFNDSIKGQFLNNRVIASGAETEVDMGFYERHWFEANIRGWESHYNQGGTFFYAGCPSLYPLDMGYCRAAESEDTLNIEWSEADKMATLSFSLWSYVG